MQNNFLASIWFVFLASLLGMFYILTSVEPTGVVFSIALICLVIAVSSLVSLIWFKFSTINRFDDPKLVFRKCFGRGFLIALIPILLILIQYYFDIV